MNRTTILGIVWALLIALTAWYVYKNFRPGLLK